MKKRLAAIVIGVCQWPVAVVATTDRSCSDTMLTAAESAVDHVKTWEDTYHLYSNYAACDDGGDVAEGLSDDVVHLLATRWKELKELDRLVTKQPGFRRFVLRHIDATADSKELSTIVELSASNCPISAALCRAIHHNAQRALSEANEVEAQETKQAP